MFRNAQTVWTADQPKLTEKQPVTLTWDNGKGHVFKRTIAIDGNYMLTVTDAVEAKAAAGNGGIGSHAGPLRPDPPAWHAACRGLLYPA